MSSFELIELAFDPEDTKPTLEDELTFTVVGRDIDKLDDIDHLKIVSKQLLKIIVHKKTCTNSTNCSISKIDSKIQEKLLTSIIKNAAVRSDKKGHAGKALG